MAESLMADCTGLMARCRVAGRWSLMLAFRGHDRHRPDGRHAGGRPAGSQGQAPSRPDGPRGQSASSSTTPAPAASCARKSCGWSRLAAICCPTEVTSAAWCTSCAWHGTPHRTAAKPPEATVLRQLVSIDGKPPRAGDEPGCLDPKPVSTEPLAMLLGGAAARVRVQLAGLRPNRGPFQRDGGLQVADSEAARGHVGRSMCEPSICRDERVDGSGSIATPPRCCGSTRD